MTFKESFDILEYWLESKRYTLSLETGADDAVYYNCKHVVLNSRNHIEKRLYVLLHECGHVLIDNGKRDRLFSISKTTEAIMGKKESRKRRVAVLSEEVEAWKRGERLARRLGIDINYEKFDKISADAIISYVEWAKD